MKLFKKIAQHKFQLFFFVGLVGLLVVALVVSARSSTTKPNDPTKDPEKPNVDPGVDVKPEELMTLPFDKTMDYTIVRKFYEKDETKENQKLGLIKYQNSYRTSLGTSFAKKDDTAFDVLAVFSGKVVEVKENPLFSNYVVIEHKDGVKTYYYGLSEVCVTVGKEVAQGDKLGVSGKTEIDAETGNHVYFKICKAGTYYNPEKLIGKKLTEIK